MSSDLIIHHHTVDQTLGQQAGVVGSQLQRAQPAQVLALKQSKKTRLASWSGIEGVEYVSAYKPGKISLACSWKSVGLLSRQALPTRTPTDWPRPWRCSASSLGLWQRDTECLRKHVSWRRGVSVKHKLDTKKTQACFTSFQFEENRTHWWRWRHARSRDSPPCWGRAGGTKTAPFLLHREGTHEIYTGAWRGRKDEDRQHDFSWIKYVNILLIVRK